MQRTTKICSHYTWRRARNHSFSALSGSHRVVESPFSDTSSHAISRRSTLTPQSIARSSTHTHPHTLFITRSSHVVTDTDADTERLANGPNPLAPRPRVLAPRAPFVQHSPLTIPFTVPFLLTPCYVYAQAVTVVCRDAVRFPFLPFVLLYSCLVLLPNLVRPFALVLEFSPRLLLVHCSTSTL